MQTYPSTYCVRVGKYAQKCTRENLPLPGPLTTHHDTRMPDLAARLPDAKRPSKKEVMGDGDGRPARDVLLSGGCGIPSTLWAPSDEAATPASWRLWPGSARLRWMRPHTSRQSLFHSLMLGIPCRSRSVRKWPPPKHAIMKQAHQLQSMGTPLPIPG